MKVCYEERNGKKYAFRSTSRREPGKKYPVTIKEYLGVVDPETGAIIPKKVKTESMKFTLKDGSFRIKDYGNVMIAKKVCDDIGIQEDLSLSFGNADRSILCLAMAQALAPTPFMDTEITLESTYIRETLGLGRTDFTSQRMSEITKILGESTGCMDDLFTLRAKRFSGDRFLYDLTSQSTYSELGGFAEWGKNRDGESLKQINIGLATSSRGDPIAFEMFPGSVSDIVTLKRFSQSMNTKVPGCTLVMDRGFESAGNIASMMDDGIDFVMPSTVGSKVMKKLLTDFAPDVTKPEFDRIHDGHVYSVQERSVGIIETESGFEYVSDDDENFADAKFRLKAYVCFDSKKRSDDEQELKIALMEKIRELDGKKFKDPARTFVKKAGWTAKYLEYSLDSEGRMNVSYRNNAMTFFRNRAGMFIMLTPNMDWEVSMTAYDTRNCVEMAFEIFKNELDGKRGRTGDPVRARGRLFIKFLALMIRVRMQLIVAEGNIKGLTVENMLMSAATYKIIDDDGLRVRNEKTKKVREIFQLFGVDDPAQLPVEDVTE